MEINSSKVPFQPYQSHTHPLNKGTAAVREGDSFRSGESRGIRSAWQALPEVRPEVVDRARKALASGEYASREIVERTAARIASELLGPRGGIQ